MRKLEIYLDTSIINFLFAADSPEYKQITKEFFDYYLNAYDVYLSEIVYVEINKTNNIEKKEQLLNALDEYGLKVYDTVNDKIEELANRYIEKKVIPEKKYEDALHIAFAAFYEFDILLSWNFKHLANIKKQIEINSINELEGYTKKLYLLNPMEVLYEREL